MTLTIVFETHSTSLDNESGLASGWFDVALSATGRGQALELGRRHAGEQIDAVYCSDLQRAYETATIAFAGTVVPILRDARLRECDYGYLTRAPAAEIERARLSRIAERFPNGESYQQATARVASALANIAERHNGGRVLIIGHRATYYALEHQLCDCSLREVIGAPFAWQPGWTYIMAAGCTD